MSKEIKGHNFFHDVCPKCGMTRKEYDDSGQPPCGEGRAQVKIPRAPATQHVGRKPRK